jgi:hypothetical protein
MRVPHARQRRDVDVRAALACAGLVACCLAPVDAQSPEETAQRKSVRVVRTDVPPVIDGKLDDACWNLAAPIGALTQMDPLVAKPATEDTEVRLLYDDARLYIGVRCFDKEPAKIVATQMKRDASLETDDRIEIVIDTFHDKRNAFYFEMSPVVPSWYWLVSCN